MGYITDLIKELGSEDFQVESRAREKLVEIGRPAVPYLVSQLQTKEVKMRTSVMYTLAWIKDFRSTPFVLKMLKDEDFHIREIAAKLLGDLNYEWGLPELALALRDVHYHVQSGAFYALAKIGKLSIPYLIEAAKDRDVHVRRGAMFGLRDQEDISTLPTAISAFWDSDEFVREAAMQAIEHLVKSSKKTGELDLIEKKINSFFDRKGKKKPKKLLTSAIKVRLIRAKNDIAKRRDELAEEKSILLDESLKPPGPKGGMYKAGKIRNR